jgi:hypothetical protein
MESRPLQLPVRGARVTRRITAAEARLLADAATPGPWSVDDGGTEIYVRSAKSVGALAACMYGHPEENARLMAAAPDLAASLIAAEAERDALREEARSALAKYDAVYCDDGYNGDREAALAKLREAVK